MSFPAGARPLSCRAGGICHRFGLKESVARPQGRLPGESRGRCEDVPHGWGVTPAARLHAVHFPLCLGDSGSVLDRVPLTEKKPRMVVFTWCPFL